MFAIKNIKRLYLTVLGHCKTCRKKGKSEQTLLCMICLSLMFINIITDCFYMAGLVEMLWQREDFQALVSALQLCKCFKARLWEDSKHVSKQLDGIGE